MALPDAAARAAIFLARAVPLLASFDRERVAHVVAHATHGRSGAELELVANEAALLAARRRADSVDERHVAAALDRLLSAGSYAKAESLCAELESVTAGVHSSMMQPPRLPS